MAQLLDSILLRKANEKLSFTAEKVLAIHLLEKSTLDENNINSARIQFLRMENALDCSKFTYRVVIVCTSKFEKLKSILRNKAQERTSQGCGASLTA